MSSQIKATLGFVVLVFGLSSPLPGAEFQAESFSEIGELQRQVLASHFLMRTTFGPTTPEIQELANRIGQIGWKPALEEWIDAQFEDYPIGNDWRQYHADRGRIWPLAKKMLNDMGYRSSRFGNRSEQGGVKSRNQWKEHAWWHRTLTSKDQLRQRMAWALSQIFVVGEGPGVFQNRELDTSANPRWLGLLKYYDDVCITNAFGNYRELIESVSYHPVMGVYLTSVRNRKANEAAGYYPDENFARELMQLFSIGLVELNADGEPKVGPDGELIETYDNRTVSQMARVFTGLVYNNNNRNNDAFGAGVNLHARMEMYEPEHDVGRKVIFQGKLVIPPRNRTDTNAHRDIGDVLDFLAYDHPNTAPFICRQLIQRFVMSNPPKQYVRRVVNVWNENQSNTNQFQEVLKAILLDGTALRTLQFRKIRSPRPALSVTRRWPTERTRLREPVLRYTALLRAFSPYPDPSFVSERGRPYYTPGGPEGEAGNQYFFIDNNSLGLSDSLGQAPFESESVFNFYVPDYQAPGPIANYVPTKDVISGKLVTPEFQIVSPVTAVRTMNHFRDTLVDSDFDIGDQEEINRRVVLDVHLDLSRYFEDGKVLGDSGTEPTAQHLNDLLEELDLLLCAGTMSPATKQALIRACQLELDARTVDKSYQKEDMVQAIISVLVATPDCAIIP